MKRLVIIVLIPLILLAGALYWLFDYLALTKPDQFSSSQNTTQPSVSVISENKILETVELEREIFAQNLSVPWSIVWTSENRVLVSERDGFIRSIVNGNLTQTPLYSFENISQRSEEGLMGLSVDPQYEQNKYIYACYAFNKGSQIADRVVRLTDNGENLSNETTLIDNLPAAQFHAGCRIGFGPDEKLYITTGDALDKEKAQDQNSLAGKILRINKDGTIPQDNPFPNSPVWSTGHRNPQGLAWHPITNELWSTEHGPSGNDGPGGGDEVNLIVKGENYGWPKVSHEKTDPQFQTPKQVFTPAVAPASAVFYGGQAIPQFNNNLFFGALRGNALVRLELTEDNKAIKSFEKLNLTTDLGRIRDVALGPDGYIYFSTSNKDGRGSAKQNDDKIYRIVPKNR